RGEPAQIANDNRVVDAELRPQRGADFRRDVAVGGEFAEGITRRQRQQHEQNQADAEQTGQGNEQAPENVSSHSLVPLTRLKRDEIELNRHRALAPCLSMIFSENRFTLFRIMLW